MQPRRVERTFANGRMEAKKAQDAQIILGDARRGIADKANFASFQVGLAAGVIVQTTVRRQRQRVDGEVSAQRVLFEIAAETHLRGAPIRLDILAQRRHLERLPLHDDRHCAMGDAGGDGLQPGVLRGLGDRFGQGRGGDVDLMRLKTQQRVAHGAADDPRFATGGGERHEQARELWIVQNTAGARHSNRPGTRRPFSI